MVWWAACLKNSELFGTSHTWIQFPAFGADFWSESDYAARLWRAGLDPYEPTRHLFHYPPIVIRLFLWTPFFEAPTALHIWVAVLAFLLVAGAVVAYRTRQLISSSYVPRVLVVAMVLLSLPSLFTLERANFDLITLAAVLVALPLLDTDSGLAEVLAGCLLAVGPWVKIYPGLMGFGLLALRRFRAGLGFMFGGVAIGPRCSRRDTPIVRGARSSNSANALRLSSVAVSGVVALPLDWLVQSSSTASDECLFTTPRRDPRIGGRGVGSRRPPRLGSGTSLPLPAA